MQQLRSLRLVLEAHRDDGTAGLAVCIRFIFFSLLRELDLHISTVVLDRFARPITDQAYSE